MRGLQHPSVEVTDPLAAASSSGRPARRVVALALLCALAVAVVGGSVLHAMRRHDRALERQNERAAAPEVLTAIQGQPHLLYLQTDGDADRQVALTPMDAPDEGAQLTSLRCQRVYFAGGRGLCLGRDQFGSGAAVFDASFKIVHTLPSNGIPSRVRVSSDGRYGSMTVFVQGHSYAEGGFSTYTALVDMESGEIITDLEEFTVMRNGSQIRVPDFNFWGVTFAKDSNRFYATLATGGQTYLVEGDIAARRVWTLRENVECPSLSPDNARIAFKKRMPNSGGRVRWQAHVLDLATMTEVPLAETRNIDDQIEWLDDKTVIFSLPDDGPPATIRPDLWAVPADGSGVPHLIATRGLSPVVIRSGI